MVRFENIFKCSSLINTKKSIHVRTKNGIRQYIFFRILQRVFLDRIICGLLIVLYQAFNSNGQYLQFMKSFSRILQDKYNIQ